MVTKYTDASGTVYHYNEQGHFHREDGPAIEYSDLEKDWYINGLFHRIDGPAIESSGGSAYYLMGKCLSYDRWLAIKDFPLLW